VFEVAGIEAHQHREPGNAMHRPCSCKALDQHQGVLGLRADSKRQPGDPAVIGKLFGPVRGDLLDVPQRAVDIAERKEKEVAPQPCP
jgi:hypothetical protein